MRLSLIPTIRHKRLRRPRAHAPAGPHGRRSRSVLGLSQLKQVTRSVLTK